MVSMVRKLFAGRVTFHDGVSEIAPGITLHHIGGHAMGLQSIRVKTKRGFVMLAADAVHLFPHLDEARIFPTTYNLGRGAGGLRDAEEARDLAQPHRAGPRSGGDEDLSGGVGCVEGLGDPPGRRSEGVRLSVASRLRRALRDVGMAGLRPTMTLNLGPNRTHHVMLRRLLREAAEHHAARYRARSRTTPTPPCRLRSAPP